MKALSQRLVGYTLGLTEGVWLLALVAVPVFFNTHSFRIFEADKATLARWLAGLALILLAVTPRPKRGGAWSAALAKPLVIPVAALLGAALVSTAFSVAPPVSLVGSYYRLQGVGTVAAYFVLALAVVATVRCREQVDRAVTAAIVASLPVALYGILQRLGWDPLPWAGETRHRVSGPMGHPTFLAWYLAMIVPLVVGRIVLAGSAARGRDNGDEAARRDAWPGLLAYTSILAVDLFALWFTGSRGGGLALLVALFFFLALLLRGRYRAVARLGLAAWGGATLLLVLLNIPHGPLQSLRGAPRLGRFSELLQTESGTVRGRVLIWRAVFELLGRSEPLSLTAGGGDTWHRVRWLVGYGPETMRFVFPQVAPPELADLEDPALFTDSAHNAILDTLVAGGLLGLLAYGGLLLAVLYHGVKWAALPLARPGPILAWVAAGGILGASVVGLGWGPAFLGIGLPFGMLIGLAIFILKSSWRMGPETVTREARHTALDRKRGVVAVSLFSALIGHVVASQLGVATVTAELLFWLLLALLWVLGEKDLEAAAEGNRPAGKGEGLVAGWSLPLGGVGAGLALGVVPLLMIASLRVVQDDMAFAEARRLADLGDLEGARPLFQRALSLCPWEDHYRREWARTLGRVAEETLDPAARDRLFDQAREALVGARRLAPWSPETATALARLDLTWAALSTEPPLRARRARAAEAAYGDALRLSPREPDLWNEAAALAMDFGDRRDLAAGRLDRSLALDPYRETTHLLRRQLEARRRKGLDGGGRR